MPTASGTPHIAETTRALVKATQAIKDSAVAGDFEGLARTIERREEIIAVFRSMNDLANLPTGDRNEIIAALKKIQEMEAEVRQVLESEMAADNRAIVDVATKSKALSAYERVVPKPRRFDTHK
ncbi:MAG: flagellar protein FliT [Bacillota bacterium]|jgi:hypothetical protein|nr:flagellar protein FliT [Candidatus Fermentithermobacillaceae bacterium]